MKLSAYQRETGTSDQALADELGVTIHAVRKWKAGQRIPRPTHARAIMEATGGAVTIADFYAGAAE